MIKIGKREKTLKKLLNGYSAVVVTGASSGIGESFIFLVDSVAKGILICNLSRKKISLESSKNEIMDLRCDISSLEQINSCFDTIKTRVCEKGSTNKKILLINNAGFGAYGEFPLPDLAHISGMIDLNVRGLTHMTGIFLPLLKEHGGGIINIASTAAWQPCPFLDVYGATKSYVMSFTLGLSYELRKSGVKVTCICPGPTSSNFFITAGLKKRLPEPWWYKGHTSPQVALSSMLAFAKGKKLHVIGLLNKAMCLGSYIMPKTLLTGISGWILAKFRA